MRSTLVNADASSGKCGGALAHLLERGPGGENARQFVKDHPDARQQLDTEFRKPLGVIRKEPEPTPSLVEAEKPATANAAARSR